MKAIKLSTTIRNGNKIILDLPAGTVEGPAEVIVLIEDESAHACPVTLMGHLDKLMSKKSGRSKQDIDEQIEHERGWWE